MSKILASDRVNLSIPRISDLDAFLYSVSKSHELHNPWVTPPANKEDYTQYIERISSINQEGFFIRLNNSDDIVGVVNINEIIRGCLQSGFLGYYAFSGFERQGLMSEGLDLVISYAFNQLNLHRLESNINPDNIKSINFIKRQNFRHEGYSPKYLLINGKWEGHERFALTVEDFTSNLETKPY